MKPKNALLDEEIVALEAQQRSGARILNQVEKYLGRFVAYPSEHARVAHVRS